MMKKYKPTSFNTSINISYNNPLKTFLSLIFITFVVIFCFYNIAIFVLQNTIHIITAKTEEKLFGTIDFRQTDIMDFTYPKTAKFQKAQKQLQNIFKKIQNLDLKRKYSKYNIFLAKSNLMNAVALPGGTIIVTDKLFFTATPEELLFVLSHEMGHLQKQHNLKSMGIALLIGQGLEPIFGNDFLYDFVKHLQIFNILSNVNSQQNEIEADNFGLEIIMKINKSYKGAIDFFSRLRKHENSLGRIRNKLFSTHPLSQERYDNVIKQTKISLNISNPSTS